VSGRGGDVNGAGEQADGLSVISRHEDPVGAEGASPGRLGNPRLQTVALPGWSSEDEMSVNGNRPIACSVGGKRQRAVGQREHHAPVTHLEGVQVIRANIERHNDLRVGDRDQLDPQRS